jgi:hypothetical protein
LWKSCKTPWCYPATDCSGSGGFFVCYSFGFGLLKFAASFVTFPTLVCYSYNFGLLFLFHICHFFLYFKDLGGFFCLLFFWFWFVKICCFVCYLPTLICNILTYCHRLQRFRVGLALSYLSDVRRVRRPLPRPTCYASMLSSDSISFEGRRFSHCLALAFWWYFKFSDCITYASSSVGLILFQRFLLPQIAAFRVGLPSPTCQTFRGCADRCQL